MRTLVLSLLFLCVLILAACGTQPAPATSQVSTTTLITTETVNPEPDPCSLDHLPTTVQPLNDLMREFDETTQVAANLPVAQLPEVISKLQRIRRDAQDVQIPTCLGTLKTHQLNHMELTIQTLIAFVGGANQQELAKGLELARQEHELYSLELVRLLGVTLAPLTATSPTSQETPAAPSTP